MQEVALELIQAGFTPTDLGVLRDKIRYVVHGVIESAIEKYRIPLQESISAFVVPGKCLLCKIYIKLTESSRSSRGSRGRTDILLLITTVERSFDANIIYRPEGTGTCRCHHCLNVCEMLNSSDSDRTVSYASHIPETI